MDYLDPKKELRERILLWVSYVLVAVAILMATYVLIYVAKGFWLNKDGVVIQNGLVFFSSQPNPAKVYVNDKLEPATTNTRLWLPAGIYNVRLSRNGYYDWQRTIELQGGDVEHFDYPLLFPTELTTKPIHPYNSAPGLITQSPDRRWLLIQSPGSMTSFDVYDLKNPAKAPTIIALPANLLAKSTTSQSWQLEEWADDNQHVVLQHDYDGKTEYVLLDRTNPNQSLNLNSTLSATPTKLTLGDKKYDHYYLYDAASGNLQTASLQASAPVTVLQHVLAYKSYGSDTLLYATNDGAPAGKVLVKLSTGGHVYPIHTFPAGTTYLMDLTKYNGTLYVVTGASSVSKIYIYADPVGQLGSSPRHVLVPAQVLHVSTPNYISFSTNAQFIAVENGKQFGVYDIENLKGYSYIETRPLDMPQAHATWMDGDRLTYVSGGKLEVFDYDNSNQHTLMSALSNYLPVFAPDYKNVYALAPGSGGQVGLTQTSLLTPADR